MSSTLTQTDLHAVAQVPLLEGLTAEEMEALIGRALVRRYSPRTVLMEKGDAASTLYVILQGRVRIYARGDDDKEVTLNELGEGEYFGELALLDDTTRSASAMTLADTRLLAISKPAFSHFIATTPDAVLRIIHDLTQKVRSLTLDVERLALRDVYGRLVDVLNQRAQEEDGRLVTDAITQKELAQLIGASREMVSRIFKDLKAGDYISLDGKRVVLHKKLPDRW